MDNMTPARRIIQQLAAYPPGQAGEIQVTEAGVDLWMRVTDWDRLGCLLDSLEMRSAQALPLLFDPFRIAQRVTYLGEPLQVIEMVKGGGQALVRSAPPCMRDGSVSFFEMILNRQRELSLRRYAVDAECGQRKGVPAPLTRHTLERLVVDLLDLASSR
jgi:hypothetical protein